WWPRAKANCDWPNGAGEPNASASAPLSTPAPSSRARRRQPGFAARAASARESSGRGATWGPPRSSARRGGCAVLFVDGFVAGAGRPFGEGGGSPPCRGGLAGARLWNVVIGWGLGGDCSTWRSLASPTDTVGPRRHRGHAPSLRRVLRRLLQSALPRLLQSA